MLDNLDLFDQSGFGASDNKLRPIGDDKEDMINFEGFGLYFEEEEDPPEGGRGMGSGPAGAAKGNKKAEKLRKEFEKLMLGTDAQTVKEVTRRATQRVEQIKKAEPKQDQLVLRSDHFFDVDKALLQDPLTGLYAGHSTNTFVKDTRTKVEPEPLLNQLKLEADNGFLGLLDLPMGKDEEPFFAPMLFKEEAG